MVVLAPNSFRTTERVPAWACLKMLSDEDFEVSELKKKSEEKYSIAKIVSCFRYPSFMNILSDASNTKRSELSKHHILTIFPTINTRSSWPFGKFITLTRHY